jgi:hypothetical protein
MVFWGFFSLIYNTNKDDDEDCQEHHEDDEYSSLFLDFFSISIKKY